MRVTEVTSAENGMSRRGGSAEALGRVARVGAAASVSAMVIILDLISFSQLIFSGPLAESRAAGVSAMLAAYVLGSLVFVACRPTLPVTLSFIGAAAIVQAAIAAVVAEQLRAAGVTDPELVGRVVLVACGISTFAIGLAFALLGTMRASLLAQLLPYPVLTGFLGGVGLLFLHSGLQIGAQLEDPVATLIGAFSPAALDPTPFDPGALGRIGVTLGIGVCAFYLPRRVRHWSTYPAVILASLVVVHLGLAWQGIDTTAAQAAGWLIEPLPAGSMLVAPAVASLQAFDPALLLTILPKIITEVVVAIIIQILFVVSVELEMRRELNIDRMFVASGAANLVGSLFGSPAMGFGRTSTLLLHKIGGGTWLGWSLTTAVMAALLVFGASPLAALPRPLAGGALIAIGLGLLVNLVLACRSFSGWETGIALVVCAATAFFGATTGFLVGVVLAILIFAVQYGQIPAIRRALSGAERSSSVIRAPETARVLRATGGRTRIYTLQGYLFFLNAQAIHRQTAAEVGGLRILILDFRECVGLDSSALVVFRKIGQLAEQHGFDVALVHLDAGALRQIVRSSLRAETRIRVLDTLDEALRYAETALLAEAGVSGESDATMFAQHIGRALGRSFEAVEFEPYLAVRALTAGEPLMRQGEEADAMYFVESGLVSIEMEVAGRSNLRLRTTTAGTVIGEIAMVQGGRRTANAIAETSCRVVGLDRAALARMERERPDLALHLQRFLILELAGKVADTNRLLEAELR